MARALAGAREEAERWREPERSQSQSQCPSQRRSVSDKTMSVVSVSARGAAFQDASGTNVSPSAPLELRCSSENTDMRSAVASCIAARQAASKEAYTT